MLNDDLNSALMGEDDSKFGDDATSTATNDDQGSMNGGEMDSNKLESTNGEGEDNADTGGNNMEHKGMAQYERTALFGNLGSDTSSDESDMEVNSSKKNDNDSKLAHESDSDGVDRMEDGGSLTEEESKNLKYLLEKANRPVGEVEDHSGENKKRTKKRKLSNTTNIVKPSNARERSTRVKAMKARKRGIMAKAGSNSGDNPENDA